MKSYLLLACAALLSLPATAESWALSTKVYTEHSKFAARPFADDDTAVGIFYEYFDGAGAWRLGLHYVGSVGEKTVDPAADPMLASPAIDSVLTPEITLLIQDGMWQLGVGALLDYVETEEDSDWGDVYYQLQLGINFPLSGFQLGVHALYQFESFDDVGDISGSNLDYGLDLRFQF